MRLAELIRTGLDASQPIKVLDLCSGTGCIPIGLAHYVPQGSTLYGVDVNPRAVELIRKNTLVNAGLLQGRELVPLCSDVLDDTSSLARTIQTDSVDLVTANPPYVYADEYRHGTDLAVRRFEPRLALIGGVEFYEKIYQHARALRAKAIVFEVGNSHQIEFVRRLAAKFDWKSVPVQDSAKNPRGVALWNDPNWEFLAAMTD
jgi:HemK-like putative methylase